MKKIIFGLFVFFSCNSNAQVLQEKSTTYKLMNGQIYKNDLSNSYSGSLYINENYRDVEVENKKIDFNSRLRYNAYFDEMEFEKNDETYILDRVDNLKIVFLFPRETYLLLHYTYKDNKYYGYLKSLYSGSKYNLLKREKISLQENNTNTGVFKTENYTDSNKKYAKEKDIYLIENNNQFYEFPNSIKKLSKLLNSNKIEDYYKKNNLNINLENDKIKLIQYINTI